MLLSGFLQEDYPGSNMEFRIQVNNQFNIG
jgi:hypothetical protein